MINTPTTASQKTQFFPHENAIYSAIPGSRKHQFGKLQQSRGLPILSSNFASPRPNTQGMKGIDESVQKYSDATNKKHTNYVTPRSSDKSMITLKSLQEAENFDKDIKNIMNVVNGIEKDFHAQKLNQQFRKQKLNLTQNMNDAATINQNVSIFSQRKQSQQSNKSFNQSGIFVRRHLPYQYQNLSALNQQSINHDLEHQSLIIQSQGDQQQNFSSNKKDNRRDIVAKSMDLKGNFSYRIKSHKAKDITISNSSLKQSLTSFRHPYQMRNDQSSNKMIAEQLNLDYISHHYSRSPDEIIPEVSVSNPLMSRKSIQDNIVVQDMTLNQQSIQFQSIQSHYKKPESRQKVIMHVNKFIPLYMQYQKIKKQDLSQIALDYALPENNKIKQQLIEFDRKIIEVYNQRQNRYEQEQYMDQRNDLMVEMDDEEINQEKAYSFQLQDIRILRDCYHQSLQGLILNLEDQEKAFQKERDFFLKQAYKDEQTQQSLNDKIQHLEVLLEEEKQFSHQLMIEEEISRICDQAYLKYNHIQEINDIEDKKSKQKSDFDGVTGKPSSKDKNIKYKQFYQDLQHEFTYEKKVNESLISTLENKISELIAENGTLKNSNILLKQQNYEFNSQNHFNNLEFEELQQQLQSITSEHQYLLNKIQSENDTRVASHLHEIVKSDLDFSKAEITNLRTKVAVLENDKSTLISQITSFKNSLAWISSKMEQTYRDVVININQKMQKLNNRIDRVSETFRETLLYSNKTHYLEEINRLKNQNNQIQKKNQMLMDKISLLERKSLEANKAPFIMDSTNNHHVSEESSKQRPLNIITEEHLRMDDMIINDYSSDNTQLRSHLNQSI